ncbi:MAG: gamma-glutamyltransferase [Bacillota bacterium]
MRSRRTMIIVSLYLVAAAGLFLYSVNFGSPFQGLPVSSAREQSREQGESTANGFGVSASHHLAVDVGMEILRQGGNAVDAAVAVGYALGVVEPYASGIGGGGVALVYPSGGSEPVVFDYRERASLSGKVPASYAGVPGFVLGMEEMHREYGSLPLSMLIEPSIKLAAEGFAIDGYLAERLRTNQYRMPVHELRHFYPEGEPLKTGERLVQTALAETLRTIRNQGAAAFYRGTMADQVAGRVPGLEPADFALYRVEQKEPLTVSIGDYHVYSTPAPYSGATLLQILKLAQLTGVSEATNRVDFIHTMADIIETSYQERAKTIGDPAFSEIDEKALVSDARMQELLAGLAESGLPGIVFPDPVLEEDKDGNTTHYVIVDSEGNMVSSTHSISQFFGSAIYVDGFFMNNQLRNFSQSAASPNRVEAGKAPRSYMSPVIIAKDGRPFIGLGTPGGNWIPMVLGQVLIDFMAGRSLGDAVEKPRFYVYDNNVIFFEEEISGEEKEALRERGYSVFVLDEPVATAVQGMVLDLERNRLYGVSEYYRAGKWSAEQISWD